jgi:hypothetical protein
MAMPISISETRLRRFLAAARKVAAGSAVSDPIGLLAVEEERRDCRKSP